MEPTDEDDEENHVLIKKTKGLRQQKYMAKDDELDESDAAL